MFPKRERCNMSICRAWQRLCQHQFSRWQYKPDAPVPLIKEVQTLTGWLTWIWHVLSCPVAHTLGGSNHGCLWSSVKLKSLPFYCASERAAAVPRVVIFQLVSGWLSAVVCHTVDLEETLRDGPCLRTQTRKEDMQPWGQKVLWSHIPQLLQRCLQPWLKYPLKSCKHCGHNIMLPFKHIDIYIVFVTMSEQLQG